MDWQHIRAVRDAVTPFLEKRRNAGMIGSSLDAKIYLNAAHPELAKILKENWEQLPRILIVSQVYALESAATGTEEAVYSVHGIETKINLLIEKADGLKCVRCWNYSKAVGVNAEHPGLCEKCLDAIK